METHINPSMMSAILILMATASLFTMLSLTQINYLVHGDLYNYGLQFSYRWAMPYWIFSGIVFGLAWLNITISIIVTLYIFKKTRIQKPSADRPLQTQTVEQETQTWEDEQQRKLNEYLEPQKEEIQEQPPETLATELIEEEVRQPETVEVQEPSSPQKTEGSQPSEENEEAHIPPEEIERRQSVP